MTENVPDQYRLDYVVVDFISFCWALCKRSPLFPGSFCLSSV